MNVFGCKNLVGGSLSSAVSQPPQPVFENRMLTVRETAEFLGVTERTVYKKIRARSIPFKRLGRNIRFYAPDLIAWIRKE